MKLLNRSGLSIRPRQPFADWLAGHSSDAPSLDQLRQEAMLYLIDEVEQEQDFVDAINEHWRTIFKNELEAWDEFGDHWPAELTLELFEQWFDLDIQLMTFDLSTRTLMQANLKG
ncbi:MAG: hypothetical protein HWE12_00655 [Oceanospirillaceae bacterium]|nr:hypothetical protein [Oceanospirillaceae bacterium]